MILDVVVIAIIALFAFVGWKVGFIKSVAKIISLIVSVIVARLFYPYAREILSKLGVEKVIGEKIGEMTIDELPSFLHQAKAGVTDGVVGLVMDFLAVLLVFVVVFIATVIIMNCLKIFGKLPIISWVNGSLGAVVWVVMAVCIIFVLLYALTFSDMDNIKAMVDESIITYTMYRHNILMNFIF